MTPNQKIIQHVLGVSGLALFTIDLVIYCFRLDDRINRKLKYLKPSVKGFDLLNCLTYKLKRFDQGFEKIVISFYITFYQY